MIDRLPLDLVYYICRFLDPLTATHVLCINKTTKECDITKSLVNKHPITFRFESDVIKTTNLTMIIDSMVETIQSKEYRYYLTVNTCIGSSFEDYTMLFMTYPLWVGGARTMGRNFLIAKNWVGDAQQSQYQHLQIVCEPQYNCRFRAIKNVSVGAREAEFKVPMLLFYEGFKVLQKLYPSTCPQSLDLIVTTDVEWKVFPVWFQKVLFSSNYPGHMFKSIVGGFITI